MIELVEFPKRFFSQSGHRICPARVLILTNAANDQRDHKPSPGSPELVDVKECGPYKEQHKDDCTGDGRIIVIQFEDGFCRIILSGNEFEWQVEFKRWVAVTHVHCLSESRLV
jgi:hypothetical protein